MIDGNTASQTIVMDLIIAALPQLGYEIKQLWDRLKPDVDVSIDARYDHQRQPQAYSVFAEEHGNALALGS